MRSQAANRLDPAVRAQAKAASRAADFRALASGQKSGSQLRQENEAFAVAARSARLDIASLRSLR